MTTNIKLLGDVHLGKRFPGAPLHRRGDRERLQWAEFEQHLMDCKGVDLHVQVGDLFDEAVVPYGVIYRAAQIYRRAKDANPRTDYVVLRGNHDANRDVEKVTAFMLFREMVRGSGVVIVDANPVPLWDYIMIPWDPVKTAEEMVAEIPASWTTAFEAGVWTAIGHWDVVAIGDGPHHNMLPAKALQDLGVQRAITGHDHNAREIEIDGLPVTITGSMQPYSHSEDADERFYVTRDLADVLADPDAFKDKHLRVRLYGKEVLDVPIDCLALTLVREGEEEEAIAIDVEFEPFNFNNLLQLAVDKVGLGAAMTSKVRDKLQEAQMGEAA